MSFNFLTLNPLLESQHLCLQSIFVYPQACRSQTTMYYGSCFEITHSIIQQRVGVETTLARRRIWKNNHFGYLGECHPIWAKRLCTCIESVYTSNTKGHLHCLVIQTTQAVKRVGCTHNLLDSGEGSCYALTPENWMNGVSKVSKKDLHRSLVNSIKISSFVGHARGVAW